jgi:hypothetical protein
MLRRYFVFALAAAVLAACGGDSSTGPGATVTGTYHLQTINAQPLPFTIFSVGGDHIDVTSSRLTLNQDGSFTEVTGYRVVESGVTTNETGTTVGTYVRNGNELTFTDASDLTEYEASWDGGRHITQTTGELTLVYRK